jgi:hypothetical protein
MTALETPAAMTTTGVPKYRMLGVMVTWAVAAAGAPWGVVVVIASDGKTVTVRRVPKDH